jgi:hypothetical protein
MEACILASVFTGYVYDKTTPVFRKAMANNDPHLTKIVVSCRQMDVFSISGFHKEGVWR